MADGRSSQPRSDAELLRSVFVVLSGVLVFAVERLAYSGERPIEHRLVLAPGDRVTLTASWGNLG